MVAVAFFSALINVLMLTSSLYMLEVYDRVIPSRSIPTLVVLSLVALILFVFQGALEVVRSRIFVRLGHYLDEATSSEVFSSMTKLQKHKIPQGQALQPMRDIETIKSFLSSGGPGGLFDLPWIPFYVAVMFMFHWVLGVTAIIGAMVMITLTLLTEFRSTRPSRELIKKLAIRAELAAAGHRNSDVFSAMGMTKRFAQHYGIEGHEVTRLQKTLSDVGNGLGSISRIFRLLLQSAILGIGALLVIWNESSAGIMITGAILMGRALSPVDSIIANWKGFVASRQAWDRLQMVLGGTSYDDQRMKLPAPSQTLNVANLSILEPNGRRFIVKDVSFRLKAGQSLCIIGPSGAGKSTLVKAVANAWQPSAGRIELDGVPLDQWQNEDLGDQIGYLPQDVELLSGTIATNICRHNPTPNPERVIEATVAAGVHEMITQFREGYQTELGESGTILSAGQRQRLALARAIYGNPFLVVLDEPNSNLDAEGDAALLKAIQKMKARGSVVVAVSHRPSILEVFDYLLILKEGQLIAFGPKEEILKQHILNNGSTKGSQPAGTSVVSISRHQQGLSNT